MKQLAYMVAFYVVFAAGAVFAASSQTVDWGQLLQNPVFLGMVVPFLSSIITMPLTELLKRWGQWDGTKAQMLNAAVNGAILGVLPFFLGVYPLSLEGVFYAAVMGALGYLADRNIYRTGKSMAGADKPEFEGQ